MSLAKDDEEKPISLNNDDEELVDNSDQEDDELIDDSDSSSDANDSENDSESNDQRPKKKIKRRKRDKVSRFLDVEAAVDEDEEEELEDEEEDEAFTKEIDADEEERILRQSEAELGRFDRRFQNEEVDAEEQAAYFRERYGKRASEAEISAASAPKELLLPSVQDSLFVVRVRPGKEQDIVIQLMRKFLENAGKPSAMAFTSVFYRAGWKGYVYVEAKHKTHVLKAVDKMMDVYPTKISLVPVADMPATLYVKPEAHEARVGMWVRVRRGKFDSDLAKVVDLGDNGNRAYLKLMPRLGRADELEQVKKRKARSQRLPKRLFNPLEFPEWTNASRENAAIGAYYKYSNEEYTKEGYLIKAFPVVNLQLHDVNPSLDEISQFSSVGGISTQDATALAALQASSTANTALFRVGEPIAVSQGELRGSTGKVVSLHDDTVKIKLDGAGSRETEVAVRSIVKRFSVGDRVSVIGGSHAGEVGMVVLTEGTVVTVLAEPNFTEIQVQAKDLFHSTDSGAAVRRPGECTMHDLVQIDFQTAGIVVNIDRSYFHVLDQFGVLRKLTAKDIKAKQDSRNTLAADSYGHTIQAGDVVEALSMSQNENGAGNSSGTRRGQVLQIYRGLLFVRSSNLLENGGVFLLKALNSRLVNTRGGRSITKLGANGVTNGANARGGRDIAPKPALAINRLRGKRVRVLKGPFQGYSGAVRDIMSETMARVEIDSRYQIVTVPVEDLVELASTASGGSAMRAAFEQGSNAAGRNTGEYGNRATPAYGGRTPAYSSRTPAYGGQTPAYGGRTPAYGAQTPAYGGRTPAYGGQTPAYGSRTPAYGAQTPAYGSRTPAYGAQTPAYGSRTPAYGGQTPAYGSRTPAYGSSGRDEGFSSGAKMTLADMLLETVDVRIRGSFAGGKYEGRIATVLSVNKQRRSCTVQLLDDPSTMLNDLDMTKDVDLVAPEKKDRVRILHSDKESKLSGEYGSVVGIDGDTAIVKLESSSELKIEVLYHIGRVTAV